MKTYMSPLHPGGRPSSKPLTRVRAFSLVELLVVMAVIGILLAIAAPLIPSLLRGNQLDSSVNTLSGVMEEAREAATSGSTYVWVAFTDAPANSPLGTYVAVIQAQDGTETGINATVTPVWAVTITVPGTANLVLHNKIINLPGVQFVDLGNAKLNSTLAAKAPTGAVNLFETGMAWNVTALQYTGAGSAARFTHAIEFAPDGEAHVQGTAGTWYSNMQFGLIPSTGSNTTNSVLFNVSRLTGKTTVYRP